MWWRVSLIHFVSRVDIANSQQWRLWRRRRRRRRRMWRWWRRINPSNLLLAGRMRGTRYAGMGWDEHDLI